MGIREGLPHVVGAVGLYITFITRKVIKSKLGGVALFYKYQSSLFCVQNVNSFVLKKIESISLP